MKKTENEEGLEDTCGGSRSLNDGLVIGNSESGCAHGTRKEERGLDGVRLVLTIEGEEEGNRRTVMSGARQLRMKMRSARKEQVSRGKNVRRIGSKGKQHIGRSEENN